MKCYNFCVKNSLSKFPRTSRLWINYINYLNIVKTFIRSERTGNWHLHRTTVANTIDLFAVSGHIHYAKSARLYLQTMQDLPKQYTRLYIKFAERAVKDAKDLIQSWFTENYLFPDKAELMCFFASLTATQDSDVNYDRTNRANLCKYLAVPQ